MATGLRRQRNTLRDAALLLTDTVELRQIDPTDTKAKLMATGERLLGERGFGVAMHEIAQEAGQGNKYAVQYHFGGQQGLVAAIFATRDNHLVERRVALIEAAEQRGLLGDLPALLEIIYLPIAEQVDDQGRHSFARFWMQYAARQGALGLAEFPFGARNVQFDRLLGLIGACVGLYPRQVGRQFQMLSFLIFAALIDRDNGTATGQPIPPLGSMLSRANAMIAAALPNLSPLDA